MVLEALTVKFISIGPTQKTDTQAGPEIQPPPQEEVGKYSLSHHYYYDPMFCLKKDVSYHL
jgi:hypothetical protein